MEYPEGGFADQEVEEASFGMAEEDYTHTKAQKVIHCMEGLHDSYQKVLSLHLIEGYDYEEVCEILQISYANCRTLMSRAKESLRKKLVATS